MVNMSTYRNIWQVQSRKLHVQIYSYAVTQSYEYHVDNYLYTLTQSLTHSDTYIYTHTHIYANTYMNIHVHMHIHTFTHIYIYIYTHTHTHSHTYTIYRYFVCTYRSTCIKHLWNIHKNTYFSIFCMKLSPVVLINVIYKI
jgi:hypothetical protein